MERPNCPAHGDLARRLALGRLDDAAAATAEASVAACPHCQAWWETSLAPAASLDAAVSAGLSSVALPSRRRHHSASWLSLAATVLLSVGVGTMWLRGVGRDLPVETASIDVGAAATVPVVTVDGALVTAPAAPAHTAPAPVAASPRRPVAAISALSFEDGAVELAHADPTSDGGEVISALSFESGALQLVGSST